MNDEGIENSVRDALKDRSNTLSIRVSDATLESIDTLMEAGIVGSRSEGASFLIVEGIKYRKPLFDKIAAKIDAILQTRRELQALLDDDDELDGLTSGAEDDE